MPKFETMCATKTTENIYIQEDEALAIMREANGLNETMPVRTNEPVLKLIETPVMDEKPAVSAPDVAPLAHECPKCGALSANIAWSEKYGLCNTCAAPKLRKEQKAEIIKAKTCSCGNYKHPEAVICRDCKERKQAEVEQSATTCPKCGKTKERRHKLCNTCYRATLKPNDNNKREVARRQNINPRAQAQAEAHKKIGNQLLEALRNLELEIKFPGAKVTRDNDNDPMVCIAFNGDSYTVLDQSRAQILAENRLKKSARHAENQKTKALEQSKGSSQTNNRKK
jgi:hypothetical protein